jgi:hypothetical protein
MSEDSPNIFKKWFTALGVFIPAKKVFSLHCLLYPIQLPLHEGFLFDGNQTDAAMTLAGFPTS